MEGGPPPSIFFIRGASILKAFSIWSHSSHCAARSFAPFCALRVP